MCCLLCYTKYKIPSITRYLKNNLFCLHTFYLKLWYYFLEQFLLQQWSIYTAKNIRIITNTKTRQSCRKLFTGMKIKPMYSQYIYSLIMFTVNNKHLYNMNNEIHNYRTRYNNNLHLPIASLTKFNKGTHFTAYSSLTTYRNYKNFNKSTLKRFLYQHSFYLIAEYFEYKSGNT